MKRNATLIAVLAIAVAGGSIWLRGTAAPASNAAAVHAAAQTAAQQVSTSTATTISAPMQSTGKQFASSSDYAAAYVVFPALASNAAQALGAYSIQKKTSATAPIR